MDYPTKDDDYVRDILDDVTFDWTEKDWEDDDYDPPIYDESLDRVDNLGVF